MSNEMLALIVMYWLTTHYLHRFVSRFQPFHPKVMDASETNVINLKEAGGQVI